jgi:hypothetical protein
MNYGVLTISPFDRQFKRLSKKYPSIKAEFLSLIENLEKNPDLGTNLGKTGDITVLVHGHLPLPTWVL